MPKSKFLKVRLDADDMLQIERKARLFNMPKSQLARLLLTGGAPAQPQQSAPAPAATSFDDTRLDTIESQIADMRDALHQSAGAFDALLSQLNQILRVPTFTEYRARLHAEGIEKRENETDEQFLLRAARRYFLAHGAWPDPSNARAFGRLPAGCDAAKFPKSPPR